MECTCAVEGSNPYCSACYGIELDDLAREFKYENDGQVEP